MTSKDDDAVIVKAFEEAERKFKEFHSPEETEKRKKEEEESKKQKKIELILPDDDDDEQEDDEEMEEEGGEVEAGEDEEGGEEYDGEEQQKATAAWMKYWQDLNAYYGATGAPSQGAGWGWGGGVQQSFHGHCCHGHGSHCCCRHQNQQQSPPAAAAVPPPPPPQLDGIDPQLAGLLKSWFDSGYQLGVFQERLRQQQKK